MRKRDAKKNADTPEDGSPPKKSKKKLLILVVLVLLLGAGGGGFLVLTGGKAKAAKANAAAKTPGRPKAGKIIPFDPITMNLSDGRFLQLGFAIQQTDQPGPDIDKAKILDSVILYLGDRTYAQLVAPGGRAKAKAGLTARLAKQYPGRIWAVYFTQFVMQ